MIRLLMSLVAAGLTYPLAIFVRGWPSLFAFFLAAAVGGMVWAGWPGIARLHALWGARAEIEHRPLGAAPEEREDRGYRGGEGPASPSVEDDGTAGGGSSSAGTGGGRAP